MNVAIGNPEEINKDNEPAHDCERLSICNFGAEPLVRGDVDNEHHSGRTRWFILRSFDFERMKKKKELTSTPSLVTSQLLSGRLSIHSIHEQCVGGGVDG